MTKIAILKIILFLFCMKCLYQQQICEIQNEVLIVPSQGCILQSKIRKLQVSKISLVGELIISQEVILKYQTIEVGENAQFSFTSKNSRITLEDISENSCNDLEQSKQIKLKSSSDYEIHYYDIQEIENNDLLTIINKSPKQIPVGVKVVIFSQSGGVEYSEIESVNGQKVKLINKIKNSHVSLKFRQLSYTGTKFPQMVLLDTNTLHFKKTCLSLTGLNDLSGLVFEDIKGLNISSQDYYLRNILIFDNQKKDYQNPIKIDVYGFQNFCTVNVSRKMHLKIRFNEKNYFYFIDTIFSEFIQPYSIKNINIINSIVQFSLKLDTNLLQLSYGYIVNSLLNMKQIQNLNCVVSFSNFINVDLQLNSIAQRLKFAQVFFKGCQYDISNVSLSTLEIHASFVDGEKNSYFFKIQPLLNSNDIMLISMGNLVFQNFPKTSQSIISAQDFIQYDKVYPLDQTKYNVQVRYVEQIQFMSSSVNLLSLPNMKLQEDNTQTTLITMSQQQFEIYRRFAYQTKIYSFLTSQIILFTNNFSTILFDIGEENNRNYNFEIQTSLGKVNLDFKEFHYILFDHHHKINISLKPQVTNLSTQITLRIEIGPVLDSKYKLPVKVYFDKKQQIKSFSSDQNILIKYVENSDNSFEINVQDIQDKQKSIVIIINIGFCELNQVMENGQCMSKCSIQDSIEINGVCQSKINNEYKQIDYFYTVQNNQKYQYTNCPFNCKSCTFDSCTSCSNNLKKGQCQDELLGNFLNLNEGNNYLCKIEFCLICSENIDKCDTCIDGYSYKTNKNICVKKQSNKYYEDNKENNCIKGCKVCYDMYSCQTCEKDFTLIFDKCIQNCSDGYIFQDNDCKSTETLKGLGYQNYFDIINFECLEGYQKIYEQKCEKISDTSQRCNGEKCYKDKQCIKGMLYSAEKLSCIHCGTGCLECLNEDKCNSCSEGFTMIDNKCVCPSGYFTEYGDFQCQKCSDSCEECINSANNCISCKDETFQIKNNRCMCKSGYILKENKCIQCKIGEFSQDGYNECQKCDDSCLECNSKFNCLECKSNQYKMIDNKCTLINNENKDKDDIKESKSELTTKQIVGIVVGVVFAILMPVIIIKIYLYMKKKKLLIQQKYQINQENAQTVKDLFKTENDIEDKGLKTQNQL